MTIEQPQSHVPPEAETPISSTKLKLSSPCSNCLAQNKPSCHIYKNKKSQTAQARAARRPRRIIAIQPRNHQTQQPTQAATTSQKDTNGPQWETDTPLRQVSEDTSSPLTSREPLNEQQRDACRNWRGSASQSASSAPSEALKLPDKSLADELIQVYFSRINPGWPIVDEEDFMDRYKSTDPRKSVPLLLLNSILLVGAHVSASRRNDYKSLKACFFRRAKMLIDVQFEDDRKVYIQAALLMTWNCDHLEDIVSNSWYWIGFAARTALGLGMHRDTSQSRMSAVTKREWVRLWWVLFQFDVLVSVAHGRPQAIRRLDESDTPPLQECHFEGIPGAKVAFVTAHTHLCVILSKSMRQILQLKSSPAERADAKRQAGESLGQFVTHLPDCLRLPQPQADTWQSFLYLTYNNFLILLHRPPAQPSPNSCLAATSGDSSICADAIAVITSTFDFIGATNAFGELALPSVYTLFTSLVHGKLCGKANKGIGATAKINILLRIMNITKRMVLMGIVLTFFSQGVSWTYRPASVSVPQMGLTT
ncbi:hypothetical protein J7T55_007591 [Diaporthe amygdali]|uniref:uncharacterized protein n=1 Tax=Phomopsis amygdali TaxID=1214568 RepID=UPI0022FDFC6A|nr:uncharacterized protein J7T55_007591 [Diaporthe amygdali]KAJ0107221.1 hypothetical protein J7T55_007591 [Diaporthe amygdali]